MGFEIRWTPKAIRSFGKQITYLEEHWTAKEIFQFTKRVNKYLSFLKEQPYMYRRSSKLKHSHIGVIIKQVSVVYRVKPKSDVIEIITFLDNRRDPNQQSF